MVSQKTGNETRSNEHRFGVIFHHAAIGIVITDEDGRIININSYAERQCGYRKKELLKKNVGVLIPNGNYSHINGSRGRQMGTNQETYALRKDGSRFPVEISLSPYLLNGEVYLIIILVDITIRKKNEATVLQQKKELQRVTEEITALNMQLEQKVEARTRMLQEALFELERSKEELNDALENEKHISDLKSKFVTLASHEFRTPLTTILSSAFLLEKYSDIEAGDQKTKHIQRIKSSVLALKNILDDFLSVGKLEEGKIKNIETQLSAGEIQKLIHNVIEELQQLLKADQQIVVECSADGDIKADPDILKNIIINLLSNAIKFSPEGAPINIRCVSDERGLSIAVKDQGIGISRQDMTHLSERFFRATNAANIQGTGLGLYIVKKYLEFIRGSIEIQSKLNEGSCFTIYLPTL
jgi:PAS domain S-box-containing protein